MDNVNWKKMYALLCGAISDALDVLPPNDGNTEGCRILRKALLEAEEMYISGGAEAEAEA